MAATVACATDLTSTCPACWHRTLRRSAPRCSRAVPAQLVDASGNQQVSLVAATQRAHTQVSQLGELSDAQTGSHLGRLHSPPGESPVLDLRPGGDGTLVPGPPTLRPPARPTPLPGAASTPVELPATIRTFLAAHAAGEARTAVRLFTDDLIGELTISADVAARPSGRKIDS